MTREERMAARSARIEARRAERAASAIVAPQAPTPLPPPRLTRQGAQETTVRKPCGCTRNKG
jgi:hypothetical protein